MIWTNEFLHRMALEAEEHIARELKCIVDRISLSTSVGTSAYQLPEYVLDIKKVYWKGWRLDPIPNYGMDQSYSIQVWSDGAFNADAFNRDAYHIGHYIEETILGANVVGGRPTQYYYYGFGENFIRINPPANEILLYYPDGLWSENINQSLIVEFYRTADGEIWKIPSYIRRRMLKSYVVWKAFAIEGPGQNLNAAKFHEKKFIAQMARAKLILDNLYRANRNVAPSQPAPVNPGNGRYYNFDGNYGYQGECKPARPTLPSNYGIVVEE